MLQTTTTTIKQKTNQLETLNQSHLLNFQLLTGSQTKMSTTNIPNNTTVYQFASNNTVSSAQASLTEKLKELNNNSQLFNGPRRRVHLSEEVAKEFKTPLPREQKLFHFTPGKNTSSLQVQTQATTGFKASHPIVTANSFLDNSSNQSNHGRDTNVSS